MKFHTLNYVSDALHRFVFDNTPVRGNIVHLNQSFKLALQHQQLPKVLHQALGELMAASVLLATTIKTNGALILQLQGKGALKLLVVEYNSDLTLRATAKWAGDISNESLIKLVGNGQFMITLDPKDGGQAYQGIVPLEGDCISQMLENYMTRSQQIDTKLWLQCDENSAAGMLLQKLPNKIEQDADAWNRIGLLANTVTPEELLNLASEDLLTRLFHEENVRLFSPQTFKFNCNCSSETVGNMLKMLGEIEIADILAEQGDIKVNCDFCNKRYIFDAVDAATLFVKEPIINNNSTQH